MRKTPVLFPGMALAWLMFLTACTTLPDTASLRVKGVAEPLISLNGQWKFSMDPPVAFWEQEVDFTRWQDIQVPGECQMQGFAIRHDRPYVYKREFNIPGDFAGQQILLVFHGVYSHARVWVNGAFIREHFGGFTRWQCDITRHAVAGGKNTLTVEIVDRTDEISYASGYAKHQIGGILRDVELMALPGLHFSDFCLETDLDRHYRDAELKICYELSTTSDAKVSVTLFDAGHRPVVSTVREHAPQQGQITMMVEDPLKWDAEHPRLYTLVTSLSDGRGMLMKRTDKVGFREVEVAGNRLLVNGRTVKLRGANRHDIHPLLGRMTTPELDRRDVLLAREANLNFIRTSHYPPSESFLRYCDEYGIYVEAETAVCFVHPHRSEPYRAAGSSQDDPAFTHRYLSQLEEMVDDHRNHPCVIIWSIGNENQYGSNFVKSYQWIKDHDRTRPVIFSYPGRVPDSLRIYDLLSIHYPDWKGDIEQYGIRIRGFENARMPVLFDEWAHVACYDKPTLKADPNVRNFWAQSLDSMWTRLFEADGGLGGAIWGMIDETFMLPDTLDGFRDWWGWQEGVLDFEGPCVGYGEWGIIDTWRRKKPEFWGAKKAYSPVKIPVKSIGDFTPGRELHLPVHNRFDHTNFNELEIVWSYGGKSGTLENVNLEPHQKGELVLPGMEWEEGSGLDIAFYRGDSMLVDEYSLRLGHRDPALPVPARGQLSVEDGAGSLKIGGEGFSLSVDQTTGLITGLTAGGEEMIKSGPYLNLKIPGRRFYGSVESIIDLGGDWKCRSLRHEVNGGIATIYTEGSCGDIRVAFTLGLDGQGTLSVDYELDGLPEGKLLQEVGIYFVTGDAFSELSWDREAYFTAYPESDLGSPRGMADLGYRPTMHYREKPRHEWVYDTKGYYYFGPDNQPEYANLVRSLKEHIYSFTLSTRGGNGMTVHGSGSEACRFDCINTDNLLIINKLWDYPDLLWGNYMKQISLPLRMSGSAILSIQTD